MMPKGIFSRVYKLNAEDDLGLYERLASFTAFSLALHEPGHRDQGLFPSRRIHLQRQFSVGHVSLVINKLCD